MKCVQNKTVSPDFFFYIVFFLKVYFLSNYYKSMSYNADARIFETQIVISNTTNSVGATTGSFVNLGGLSTMDTYIKGHTVINTVDVTPNLNDIVFEKQNVLDNNISEFTNIENFFFDSSKTTSFKAIINITVSAASAKYAVWEINGLYKPNGWVITASFTGDLTGVDFTIVNDAGIGRMRYKNANTTGTTTIRYRASTTAPPGSTPIGASVGVITNTTGPFLANNLIYASGVDTLASTDITYNANVLSIGGTSRILAASGSTFTNFSNGGAITSIGDASIGKKLIVGEKIGIANTAPTYQLDVVGDINFTGTFYKNGNIYSGSEIWATNGTSVYYTSGNIGVGTSAPGHSLDVNGSTRTTNLLFSNSTCTNVLATAISSGSVHTSSVSSTNVSATNSTITNILSTAVSSGSVITNTVNLGSSGLFSGSFVAANDQSSAANVTGYAFSNGSVRSFTSYATVSVARSSGGNLYESFTLEGIQTEEGWMLFISRVGNVSGVNFTITIGGQIQYTSTNQANWTSTTIKFNAIQIFI